MKSSGIGGQAVFEGVMMKNRERYAIAVRRPDNQIEVKTDEFHSIAEKVPIFRLPLFRGMAVFVESFVLGIRALSYSSSFYEEEEKGKKNQKEVSKAKEAMADVGVVALSLLMAVVVFILLPLLLSSLLGRLIHSKTVELLLEGLLRIAMFIVYVVLIAKLEDIKRVFMYHGAEHKCINCVESGEALTVANVRRQNRCYKRCGTGFLLVVLLVSFVLFMFIRVDARWMRYVLRIVLIPFIAGICYEFVRLSGSSDSKVAAVLSRPVFLLQGLTTKEPDDSMIEVAIASMEAVFDWQAYQEQQGVAKRRLKKKGKEPDAAKGAAAAAREEEEDQELLALDHIFGEPKKTVWEERPETEEEDASISAMKVPDEEEEDELLRALDRYFVFDKKKDAQNRAGEAKGRNAGQTRRKEEER